MDDPQKPAKNNWKWMVVLAVAAALVYPVVLKVLEIAKMVKTHSVPMTEQEKAEFNKAK